MAISPSRESNSTEPISRRYMRTGSSVRSASSRVLVTAGLAASSRTATALVLAVSSSAASPSSSLSTTLMPISLSWAMTFSIASESNSSLGRTLLSSS